MVAGGVCIGYDEIRSMSGQYGFLLECILVINANQSRFSTTTLCTVSSILIVFLGRQNGIISVFEEVLPEPEFHTSIKTEVISVINVGLQLDIIMRRN